MKAENPYGIQRVMHEIKRRRLQVLRVSDLTPRMRRITLGGPDLAGFLSEGPDDHIKLMFASTPEQQAVLDTMVLGAPAPDGVKPDMRDYTPRRIDLAGGELDIDFVLHGDGPASTWAAQAEPGQFLHIGGPRSSMLVPDVFDAYLLIGDETAIPAIARRLEELPAQRRALVVVEVENAQEQQVFTSAAQFEVVWVDRHQGDLLKTVRELAVPEGVVYGWIATEAGLSRKVRRVLLDEHGLNEDQVKAAGYWRAEGTEAE
ncbi:siderophore-interacting protein [Pseudomonas sp. UBA4194]|uniref:siderophore-interacting protein n=1 Tax=Pseudomonas sp. UBA4194 TaxID=1947317 RepID=UPI0025E256B9|nr:siderophore-interacting protein [Pseudomonas sp. UBA4194]